MLNLEIKLGNSIVGKGIDGSAQYVRSSALSNTLKSLDIWIDDTTLQPSYIWCNFIRQLDGLLELTINNYCIKSQWSITEYPSHLVSLTIDFDLTV
ncbi:unnamed protein product [Ambrosiozyma monospora]|uniref:Unnamed protein product n=2 Tax=Ambrosiozyma monospora TaxID=43982 RepID=A0ACB5TXW9_AMBMO|nr:unnamed protein product [Ambrosiozyma monospora]GME96993.1 unnamed protein product [Ambrosiozyma monospora]